jgi:hypothetical protein
MIDIILYFLLFIVLAGAGTLGYLYLNQHLTGGMGGGSFFGPKPEKRLDVVEQWSLDARRRLVLIRRDNVEHLIMTGGPVDVVIETGIGEKPRRATAEPTEIYARAPRGLGTPSSAAPSPALSGTGGD